MVPPTDTSDQDYVQWGLLCRMVLNLLNANFFYIIDYKLKSMAGVRICHVTIHAFHIFQEDAVGECYLNLCLYHNGLGITKRILKVEQLLCKNQGRRLLWSYQSKYKNFTNAEKAAMSGQNQQTQWRFIFNELILLQLLPPTIQRWCSESSIGDNLVRFDIL